MKKRKIGVDFDENMDMTPLIDCVFLLIMFFILTTEITVDVEEVELPFALEGKSDEGGEQEEVLLMNIVIDVEGKERGDGKIVLGGDTYDKKTLTKKFQREVEHDKDPELGRGRAPEVLADGTELSQLKIRIRADKNVKAEYLRTVFEVCAAVTPKIYKIEVSSENPSSN
ncbi:MAG: biopolymer transporter ExbD [Planctomycetota bacterium]